MNNSLSAIVSAYRSLEEQQTPFVLATLIETQGSTYRKAGARMLIDPEAKLYGMLGSDELHHFLSEHAQQVLESHKDIVVSYSPRQGNSESPVSLLILLQFLAVENNYQPLQGIAESLTTRQSDLLVTVYETEYDKLALGTDIFLSNIQDKHHGLEEHVLEEIQQIAIDVQRNGKALRCEHFIDKHSISLFYNPVPVPLSLLILGSGPDTLSVLHFAKQLGWHVTLADIDNFSLASELFSEADEIALIEPASTDSSQLIKDAQAIIIMSHDIERDKYFLEYALAGKAGYIALLASARRRDEILSSLDISKEEYQDRLYSPAGLNLGGELPEDIALSLIAQIQQHIHAQQNQTASLSAMPTNLVVPEQLAVIILAAGGSSRFGGVKQLLEYKGMSLLRRSVETAQEIIDPAQIYVVLGPKVLKMQRELTHNKVEVVANPNWESGLASSIKAGLNAIPNESTGVLFHLCDQPLITAKHIMQLIEQWKHNQDKIIASSYADIYSEPAIIPRQYFPEISKLYKDQGISQLIENQTQNVVSISIPEAAMNVDTQEDYMKLLTEM